VPTVFRWEHGGHQVYITGTFTGNWTRRMPMHRSGNDFVFIASLPPEVLHTYKFIVDDEWRFAPDQPTTADASGNINNVVDLSSFQPDDDRLDLPVSRGMGERRRSLREQQFRTMVAQQKQQAAPVHLSLSLKHSTAPSSESAAGADGTAAMSAFVPTRAQGANAVGYGHVVPDEDEYNKDPPLLPPHLRSIALNHPSPDPEEPLHLPPPQHVTLNHLYCTAIKDGLMVQAATQRYRRKFVTSVFYAVMPSASSASAVAVAASAPATHMAGAAAPDGALAPSNGLASGAGMPAGPVPMQQ
jgi:5'-AMP-activated protein kinase regulatory beta subunit